MKKIIELINKLNSNKGFSPILIVVAVALLAIPITTLLVQKQQDLRQRAESPDDQWSVTDTNITCNPDNSLKLSFTLNTGGPAHVNIGERSMGEVFAYNTSVINVHTQVEYPNSYSNQFNPNVLKLDKNYYIIVNSQVQGDPNPKEKVDFQTPKSCSKDNSDTKTPQPPASTPTPTGSSKPNDDTLPGSAICRGYGGLDKSKYVEPRCASSREDALNGGGKYDQAKARNGEFENKTYFDLYICAENSSLEAWPAGEGNTICKTPPWTVKITPGQPTPTPELGVACLETNSTCEQNACSTLGKPRNPNGDQADKACERTNPNTGKAYGKYCCLKSGGNPGGETSTPTPTSGTCYQRCDYDGTCGGTLICINHCCSNGSRPQSKAGQGQTCEPGAIECEDWLKCIPTVPNPNVHVCVPNGNPTPTPTTNPGGACSSVERPDIGCPCNSGSCGFSGLACIMASGGAGGAGCCQNVGQRWCPPASGRQGTCVNYPYICPAGNSSPSNNTPTATPTPVPPTSSPGGSGACRECSGSSDCSGSNANRSDFCGTGSRCIFRSGPTGRAIGVCG